MFEHCQPPPIAPSCCNWPLLTSQGDNNEEVNSLCCGKVSDTVNHCCQSKWPYSLPVKCKTETFSLLFNVSAVSEPNFLHLENGTSVCRNNLPAPRREGGETACSLIIGRCFSVDKMDEPDLQVSPWVTLRSMMWPNRRQTTKRQFTGISLCKFCKHAKQNWMVFVDICICMKSENKCMGMWGTKEKIVLFLEKERWGWSSEKKWGEREREKDREK